MGTTMTKITIKVSIRGSTSFQLVHVTDYDDIYKRGIHTVLSNKLEDNFSSGQFELFLNNKELANSTIYHLGWKENVVYHLSLLRSNSQIRFSTDRPGPRPTKFPKSDMILNVKIDSNTFKNHLKGLTEGNFVILNQDCSSVINYTLPLTQLNKNQSLQEQTLQIISKPGVHKPKGLSSFQGTVNEIDTKNKASIQSQLDDLRSKVKNSFTDQNIYVFGPIGQGKSGTLCNIDSCISGNISSIANVGAGKSSSITDHVECVSNSHQISNLETTATDPDFPCIEWKWRLRLWDVPGFSYDTQYGGMEDQREKQVKGLLDGVFSSGSKLEAPKTWVQQFDNLAHVALFVVKAIEPLDNYRDLLQCVADLCHERQVPLYAIITGIPNPDQKQEKAIHNAFVNAIKFDPNSRIFNLNADNETFCKNQTQQLEFLHYLLRKGGMLEKSWVCKNIRSQKFNQA